MPITWILTYWKPLFIIFALACFGIGSYHQGKKAVRAEWQASILAATEKARTIEHDNTVLSNIIGGKYETGIASIDANYHTALERVSKPSSSDMPTKTRTTGKLNSASCRNTLPIQNKRAILELAKQAELNTQKLLSLQEWVRQVH